MSRLAGAILCGGRTVSQPNGAGDKIAVRYKRAPIREATIGLEMALPAAAFPALERFTEVIAADYPQRQDHLKVNLSFAAAGQNVATTGAGTRDGFVCRSSKGPNVLQVRLDGFFFSRLAPYTTWEEFCGEAHRLWTIFVDVVSTAEVETIGVRYVNMISILPNRKLEDFLAIYPEVKARDVPIQNMFMRLELPILEIGGIAIIQEAFAPPVQPDTIGLVLDIDVRVTRNPSVELWEQIKSVRPIKNRLFEDSLTPLAKEAFNANISA